MSQAGRHKAKMAHSTHTSHTTAHAPHVPSAAQARAEPAGGPPIEHEPARKHQKYHESGPARPAAGGAQNGGDFVVIKRKMARTGRSPLAGQLEATLQCSPLWCLQSDA